MHKVKVSSKKAHVTWQSLFPMDSGLSITENDMKRYDIDIEGGDWMNAASLDITEQPDGEWVKYTDVPGLTVKGQRIPDTVEEWKYLAGLYAQQIEEDKLTIQQLKQKINKLQQRKRYGASVPPGGEV